MREIFVVRYFWFLSWHRLFQIVSNNSVLKCILYFNLNARTFNLHLPPAEIGLHFDFLAKWDFRRLFNLFTFFAVHMHVGHIDGIDGTCRWLWQQLWWTWRPWQFGRQRTVSFVIFYFTWEKRVFHSKVSLPFAVFTFASIYQKSFTAHIASTKCLSTIIITIITGAIHIMGVAMGTVLLLTLARYYRLHQRPVEAMDREDIIIHIMAATALAWI